MYNITVIFLFDLAKNNIAINPEISFASGIEALIEPYILLKFTILFMCFIVFRKNQKEEYQLTRKMLML